MESSLRPMTLGEILDRTAQLYRSNFLLFAGIFALYSGVALVLNLAQIGLSELLKAEHLARFVVLMTAITTGLNLLILFLLFGAATAAICRAVAWVNLGEPATIRGAYASTLPRLGRYLWLMTITFFRVWIPFVLLYAGLIGTLVFYGLKRMGTHAGAVAQPAAAANPQAAIIFGLVSLVFLLLLIPVGVYTILMSLRYSLAIPASVVENMKARQAIRRSIELAKGSWGRIFLLMLLIGAIKLVLICVTQAFVFVAAFKHFGQPLGPGILALSQMIGFFTNSFLGPIWATGITLFYYDQRVRKEGYDIEWMMQQAGLTPPVQQIAAASNFQTSQAVEYPQAKEPTSPAPGESL